MIAGHWRARPRAEEQEAAGAAVAPGGALRLRQLPADLVHLDHLLAGHAAAAGLLEGAEILRLQAVAIVEFEAILGVRDGLRRHERGKSGSNEAHQPQAIHGDPASIAIGAPSSKPHEYGLNQISTW